MGRNFRRGEPSALRHIKGIIILKNLVVVSTIDEYLITIDLHSVKGTSVGYDFLEMNTLKLLINAQQRIVELISRFPYVVIEIPPKMNKF